MSSEGRPVTPTGLHDQVRAASVAAGAATHLAESRHAELRRLSEQARCRREQLQEARIRLRAQLALRRSLINTPDRRAAAAILEAAVQVVGVTLPELWMDYFALGGDASVSRLAGIIAGEVAVSRGDHDRLAVVLNERLEQAGWGRPLSFWDGSR